MSAEQLFEKLQRIEGLVEDLRTEMRTMVEQANAEKVDALPPVKLFVGAKCERRNGSVVTIGSRDDSNEFCGGIYPFRDSGGKTYMENGVFLKGHNSHDDIIRVLNPEDHPDNRPPVEYREINFTDIGKCVYWDETHEMAGILGGFGMFPNGSPAAFVFNEDGESYEATPTRLVIPKSPDDKAMRERWVNVYRGDLVGAAHPSKDEADKAADCDRIARIRIQYYEGQMDA